jgi:hypothetical protein
MALAKITRPGLIAIGLLVAILWGCVLAEQYFIRRTRLETYRAMRDLRQMRLHRRAEPVSHPTSPHNPPARHSSAPVVG